MSAFLAAALLASLVVASNHTIECAPGLQIFVARGTEERPGPGVSGAIAEAVLNEISGSAFQAIDYPASNKDPVYFDSVRNGIHVVRQSLIDYTEACPNGKIALLGYSQGAQITANALSGTVVAWSPYPETGKNLDSLDDDVTKNIVAVALFGDPSLAPKAKYRKGTANPDFEGVFHRHNSSGLDALGGRLVSYCDAGDVFCDAGSDPVIPAHLHYHETYGAEVVEFFVRQYEDPDSSAPSPSASATPSVSESGATRRAMPFRW